MLLTALLLTMTAAGQTQQITVDVNGYQATAFVDRVARTLTLGNGQNACIPHYAVASGLSDFVIPGKYDGYGDYNVIIAPFAFRFCSNLVRIKVGEGVTTIGDFAFVGCGQTTAIDLPSTLKTVGCGAFVGLSLLKVIICRSATPPAWAYGDVFSYDGTAKSTAVGADKRILYVPEGSAPEGIASAYRTYKYNDVVGWGDAFGLIYEGESRVVEISSYDDLVAFRDYVNAGKIGTNEAYGAATSFLLTTDIDLAGKDWKPIGTNKADNIIFDGGGHIIKGMRNATVDGNYVGFFAEIINSTVRNLHFQYPEVSAKNDAGVVASKAVNSIFSDILIIGGVNPIVRAASSSSVGGIIGYGSNIELSRCYVEGKVDSEGGNIGGLVGCMWKGSITDCIFGWQVSSTKAVPTRVGGIVGTIGKEDNQDCKVSINRTVSWAKVSAASGTGNLAMGGLIGLIDPGNKVDVTNCGWYNPNSNLSLVGNGTTTDSNCSNYTKRSDMVEGNLVSLLEDGKWDYFYDVEEHWQNYPIPISLKEMYMNAYVNLKASDNGLVYQQNSGDIDWESDLHTTNRSASSYNVIGYTGSSESLIIPDNYQKKPVVRIGNGAFRNATFSSVTLPASLYAIDSNAFRGCKNLTSVTVPDATERIEDMVFADCISLQSLSLGKNAQYFGEGFIANCPKLTTLTVSDKNTYCKVEDLVLFSLGDDASIVACAGGKKGEYTVPLTVGGKNVRYIKSQAFAYCNGLTGITFQQRMDNIGNSHSWFIGCTKLSYVDYCSAGNSNTGGFFDKDDNRLTAGKPCYGLNDKTLLYLSCVQNLWEKRFTQGTPANTIISSTTEYDVGEASSLLLTDELGFIPKMKKIVVKDGGVTYRRIFDYNNGLNEQVSTVCLPYAVNIPSAGIKVYQPSGVFTTGNVPTVIFEEKAKTEKGEYALQAYTPYYIVVSGITELDFSNNSESITIDVANSTFPMTDYQFVGTVAMVPNASLIDAAKPGYILEDNATWRKAVQGDDDYVRPFRAYLVATGSPAAEKLIVSLEDPTDFTKTGDGSELSPYIISSHAQLIAMAMAFNGSDAEKVKGKYFKQGANIMFDRNVVNNYTPIKNFDGHYDGAGYTISGLNMDQTDNNNAALFLDMADGSLVSNVIIMNSSITGSTAAAIACVLSTTASIVNCHVLKDVTIAGNYYYAGSLVAHIRSGATATIKGCTSHATVNAYNSYASGLVGAAHDGSIIDCIYLGNSVNSQKGLSNFAVCQKNGTATINNCYFTAPTLTDLNAKLMPMEAEDNTDFLNLLHSRDEYLLKSGLTEEQIGYDVTMNGRVLSAIQQADGTWTSKAYTVCLPFEMRIAEELQEDVKVYRLHEIDLENKVFQFTNEFPFLVAGEPYVIVITKGSIAPTGKNVTIVSTPKEPQKVLTVDESKSVGRWAGTFKRINAEEGIKLNAYGMRDDGTFQRYRDDYKGYETRYIPMFRGYFEMIEPTGVNGYIIKYLHTENGAESGNETDFPTDDYEGYADIPDDETAIRPVIQTIDGDGTSHYYDLQGRPLNGKPNKGVYIQNGKKIIIK